MNEITGNELNAEERQAGIAALKEEIDRDTYPRSPRLDVMSLG